MGKKGKKREKVSPFFVMEMLQIANERQSRGENILHLEFGEPYVESPKKVISAAHELIKGGAVGYTDSIGLPALRSAIADYSLSLIHI